MSEFIECPTCAAKTGSPTLCRACINNRAAISRLELEMKDAQKALAAYRFVFARKYWGNSEIISALLTWQPGMHETIMADLRTLKLKPSASE